MKRSEVFLMVAQVPIDFLLLLLAAQSAYRLRFTEWALGLKPVGFSFTVGEFLDVVMPIAILWIVVFMLFGLYSTDPNRKLGKDIMRIIFGASVGLAGVAVYVMFTQQLFDSRFLALTSWIFAIVYIILGRLLMRVFKTLLYRWGIGQRRVIVVGPTEEATQFVDMCTKRPGLGYSIVHATDTISPSLYKVLDATPFDEVILFSPKSKEAATLKLLSYCTRLHKTFKYSADVFATYASNIAVYPVAGIPLVEIRRTKLDGWWRVIKRLFDILGSLVLLILTSPLMLISSGIILIETGRPILYKNLRVGIRGNEFFTLKFRSMYQAESTGPQFGRAGEIAEQKEAELVKQKSKKQGPIYKIVDDPRITPFGRWIRKWSVDELPQLINVLKGDMSLVGPRPHQPREVNKYKDDYPTVFTLKPGMTGLSQISGRSDLSFEEEMKLDILYTDRWNMFLDIVILLKTPFILFRKREAL